jgi:hypothetical protein
MNFGWPLTLTNLRSTGRSKHRNKRNKFEFFPILTQTMRPYGKTRNIFIRIQKNKKQNIVLYAVTIIIEFIGITAGCPEK